MSTSARRRLMRDFKVSGLVRAVYGPGPNMAPSSSHLFGSRGLSCPIP